MPGGHMAPDGQLSITVAGTKTAQRVSLGFEILPWLETSFRYSRIPGIGVRVADYDRSFGIKARLFQEGDYLPDVSLGIRDLVGTGIYSGEYLAFSKHIGDFDTTLGLGWGRLASDNALPNPLGWIFPSFKVRDLSSGKGGNFDPGSYFHGPNVGIFGGFIWHLPIDNFDFIAEYSSDKYPRESAANTIHIRTPANLALAYQLSDSMRVSAGWFYGSEFGASFEFAIDPTTPVFPGTIDEPPLAPAIRPDQKRIAAVANYVAQASPSDGIVQLPPIGSAANVLPRSDQHEREAELLDKLSRGGEVEIYGSSLLVEVHARGQAMNLCQQYARLASSIQVSTIAVTDLDAAQRVSICSDKAQSQPASLILASARSDGDVPAETFQVNSEGDPIQNVASQVPPAGLPSQESATVGTLSVVKKLQADADQQSLSVWAVSFTDSEAFIYYQNSQYATEAEAIGRLVRVAMTDLPANIEVFHFIPVIFGQPVQDVRILRAPIERMFETNGVIEEIPTATSIRAAPMAAPILDATLERTYPAFNWSLSPGINQGFFDPNQPYRIQVFAALSGSVELFRGFQIEGEVDGTIFNTFAHSLPSNSVLPHVRSDTSIYLTKGKNGISDLDAVYRTRIAPEVFVEAKAGYLEDMFAGAGGQILWRPEGSDWAFGADAYQVWQRNFDRLFGLQHYHVLTGHVSVYYRSDWHGLNFAIHAGRYLAGDYGATLEVTREFSTGVQIGAFATITNVPFQKFGEGSFDKGIIIHIPLEWNLPFSTQTSYDLLLRPLQRDGGQRLDNDDSLFEETKRTSFNEIADHEQEIGSP